MPDLTKYLPLSAMQPFFDNVSIGSNPTDAWRTKYFAQLEEIIRPALVEFFLELKKEGRLQPIPNSEGYSTRLWDAWNAAANLSVDAPAADLQGAMEAMLFKFEHHLAFDTTYEYSKHLEKLGLTSDDSFDKGAAYAKVFGEFNGGTVPFLFNHETCQNTGLPLTLRLKNWAISGLYISQNGIHPIEPAAPAKLQETVVEFKTGNLLIADWFRIEAFTKHVDAHSDSLESRNGREEIVRRLAEDFGVISVSVLNTCPGVFKDGNHLTVGYFDDEEGSLPSRFTHVGNVITDLWAVTIVEYENLVNLVAHTHPENAKETVDDYLSKQGKGLYGMHSMKVEPGTYYLYHSGEHEQFAELATAAGIKLDTGDIEPFFMLSPSRLLPVSAA